MTISWMNFCRILIPTLILSACANKPPQPVTDPSMNAATPVPIQASMQNMKLTMEGLLPFVVDKQSFESAANASRIKQDLHRLNDISRQVNHAEFKTKLDPSFGFLSEGLREEIQNADAAFGEGKYDYARYSLVNLTGYCIECHTRTASGPAFQSPDLTQTLQRLRPLERGEYLLAVRQFDAALAEFMKTLEVGQKEKFNFYDYDRALRYSLAITVKFQRDPDKTQKVIEQVLKSEHLPFFIRQASDSWLTSLRDWKREKTPKNPKVADRIAFAEKLVQRGRAAQQGQTDRSGDIDLLRGLSELHQILWTDLSKAQLGKVLLLTGQAYEATRDTTMTSLHENYFETCVRRVPHSIWSRSCYKSLEESLFMGYTGSAGTHLPKDVQAKLAELSKLAQPKTK
ncbi:MAG: hypothetical protein KF767_16950 [Bdellovibrionaceae bacterium]|nr:hypothetical protein [Pseudobdellovibrionaceae bacterium]